MNPLEPNDPLWNLLGKAREVKVRGNFVQNVVRAARQEPQKQPTWLEWLTTLPWFKPVALATAAVAVAAVSLWPSATAPQAVSEPQVAAVAPVSAEDAELIQLAESMPMMPLEAVNEMNALLAMDDTSAMTDRELAFLLY